MDFTFSVELFFSVLVALVSVDGCVGIILAIEFVAEFVSAVLVVERSSGIKK